MMSDETVQREGPAEETGEPDDALILWMLSLTPTQRLEVAQGFIDSIQVLRDGAYLEARTVTLSSVVFPTICPGRQVS
jgi:hypothetical protein